MPRLWDTNTLSVISNQTANKMKGTSENKTGREGSASQTKRYMAFRVWYLSTVG